MILKHLQYVRISDIPKFSTYI